VNGKRTPAARVKKRFSQLMEGLNLADVASLVNFEFMTSKCLEFDPHCRAVFAGERVPWPIVWLLSRTHPKFIFQPKKLPPPDAVRDAIMGFVNRVNWRYALRDDKTKPLIKTAKGKRTPPYLGILPGALSHWSHKVLSNVMGEYDRCKKRFLATKPVRTPALVAFALSLMKRYKLTALQNDKDGGFSVFPTEQYGEVESLVFEKGIYEYVGQGELNALLRCARSEADTIATTIAEYEKDPRVKSQLLKPLSNGGRSIAVLQMKIKSHKDAGEVVPRPLHTSVQYLWEGFGRWLIIQLRERLHALGCQNHLMKNSEHAKEVIEAAKVDGGEVFVRLDISDFFLSGTIDQLSDDILSTFDSSDKRCSIIKELLPFLLRNQFVRGRTEQHAAKDGAYRVLRGSGMGITHSGDLCDLAFAARVERYLCRSIIFEKFRIKLYCRFKDDALLVISRGKHLPLIQHLKVHGKYFKIKVERMDKREMEYLNLNIYKSSKATGPCLKTEYYFKPTALSIPLSSASAHPRCIHESWPKAMIASIRRLCSEPLNADKGENELRKRFSQAMVPVVWPQQQSRLTPVKGPVARNQSVLWCAMPYHPWLAKPLSSALARVQLDDPTLHAKLFGEDGITRITASGVKFAWTTYFPRLATILRALDKTI